ncbi:uncharacterized protein LOC124410029 [Diprion similis]|uniref:uncharacterized protein LOC124410029 n=1 Tax=Diprion similis TaxID=362088 RepID=UPI001EF7B382|nr:uncharacterized protein LOC124410029 [Diprion similis]XP_046744096.1 uncharacterized protein LOC124410029 [Diprion similis]
MAQSTTSSHSLANAVKMILKHFLGMQITRNSKSSLHRGCLVIDIELRANKKRDLYAVQMTHCGCWTNKGVQNLFEELCLLVKNGLLPDKAVLAHAFTRNSGNTEETSYIIEGGPIFGQKKTLLDNPIIHFPSFRNYVLIKLQYRISSDYLLEFKEILICEFNTLRESNPDVKITFYYDKDVFYTNHVQSDDDFQDCQSLSISLISIVKQSMNNKFKERCLNTVGVDNAHEAQKILGRTLFSMTHENYTIP